MKKYIPVLACFVVACAVGGFLLVRYTHPKVVSIAPVVTTPTVPAPTMALCFAKVTKQKNGLTDASFLRLDLAGSTVTGSLRFLPAEKDSKVGYFSGTVSAVDKVAMARTIDAWWDTEAEGMQTKEQVRIVFGEGTAQVGMGEMVDRGDGVYVYRDIHTITYTEPMSDVDCGTVSTALPAQYVGTTAPWPPEVTVATGAYSCNTTKPTGEVATTISEKSIHGHTYCVTTESEGAAGSTYTTYTYESALGAVRHKVNFVLRRVQCMNYDEPVQSACIQTQRDFDVDAVADALISQVQ